MIILVRVRLIILKKCWQMSVIYGQEFDFPYVFDSWLREFATIWKVAGSIPDGVIGIFHWLSPSVRTGVKSDFNKNEYQGFLLEI
jgi:hypothetical protein